MSLILDSISKYKMKTLRRTVIIRENEYMDLVAKFVKTGLYDRGDFEPLTYKGMQQENLVLTLKDQKTPVQRTLPDIYQEMLFREKRLYNTRYKDWELTMDYPNGQVWVQSRDRYAKQRLVVATFEKDL
jgi:hypothetical protein